MIVAAGSTDVTTYFVIRTASDGTATTGATITNIDLQYCRSGAAPAAKVDATALVATDSAHADNKAFEIDATDQPGLYRVDWPDAAFAAGVREVILSVKLASSFTEHLRVELSPAVDAVAISGDSVAADNLESACDNYSATRGLTGTALPAAVADAAGGVPISDAGNLALDTQLANTHEVTAARMGALSDWINDGRLDLLLDAIKAVTDALPNAGALSDIDTGVNNLETWVGTAGVGLTDLGGMSNGMKAEVNAEALDVINTDTFAEPAQGAPGATVSIVDKIGFLYKAWRNKIDQDADTYQLYNDDASTVDHKATVSDDGTTFTRGEVATGP